jgi:hypothetical protein
MQTLLSENLKSLRLLLTINVIVGFFTLLFVAFLSLLTISKIDFLSQTVLKIAGGQYKVTWNISNDPTQCGSGGCLIQILDKSGKPLYQDISFHEPVPLTNDSYPDFLIYHRLYPVTIKDNKSVLRLVKVCPNQEKNSYSPGFCEFYSLDNFFIGIEELKNLKL